jgi:hypothetical protein
MILLDTNVVSALMQKQPDPAVVTWLDAQSIQDIWLPIRIQIAGVLCRREFRCCSISSSRSECLRWMLLPLSTPPSA